MEFLDDRARARARVESTTKWRMADGAGGRYLSLGELAEE